MQPNKFYHVYTHANGNENLFRNDGNYIYFLNKYLLYIDPIAETFAYCLMPNHIHFLLKIKNKESIESLGKFQTFLTLKEVETKISKQFSNLFSCYTQSYNKVFNRKGSLFISNFKRKKITNNSYLRNTIHYIHYNPVHHGFCKTPEDWKYTSWHSFVSSKPTRLNREAVLQLFNGKEGFISYHKQPYCKLLALEMDF